MSSCDEDNTVIDAITLNPTLPTKIDSEPDLSIVIGSPNLTAGVAVWEQEARGVVSVLHAVLANTTALSKASRAFTCRNGVGEC